MHILFSGDLVPLTNGFGFVKADFNEAVDIYNNWMIGNKASDFTKISLDMSFRDALVKLPPFQFYNRAILFKTNSEWVGYTNNNIVTAEIGKINVVGRTLKSETVQVKAYPPTTDLNANGWCVGGFLYQNFKTDAFRSIFFSYQDRWELDLSGDPLPFELIEKYKEKRVKDRFTPEMLDFYCKSVGIDFFNEDFYLGGKDNIVLFTRERPLYDNEIPQPLEEARKIYLI